eukprot:TRINITY_DN2801_c0_g1_i2.p1 TRINITY_DN2801_c0_g1~~TRINITY_DN2801_c0_g1_i2.p1  ORF type:complete len:139 (-),score=28.32 TRINITY_DN2801_c0_g1_i2:172-588(-)
MAWATAVLALACLGTAVVRADDWTVLADHLGPMVGCSFFDVNTGIAVGYEKVHRTIDGGATWTEVVLGDGVQTARFKDVLASSQYAVIAGVGDSSMIPGSLYSTDQGVTFNKTDETHLRQVWFDVKTIPGHEGSFVKV